MLVLRRRLRETKQTKPDARQPELPELVIEHTGGDWYEHLVLVTNWDQPGMLAIAQVYRDRGDTKNVIDEVNSGVGRGFRRRIWSATS